MIFKHCDKQSLRNCMKSMKSQLPYSRISSSKTYLKLSLKWRSRRCAHDWSAFLRKLRHWSLRSTAATASSLPGNVRLLRRLEGLEILRSKTSFHICSSSFSRLSASLQQRACAQIQIRVRVWKFSRPHTALRDQVVMAQLLSSPSVHKVSLDHQ